MLMRNAQNVVVKDTTQLCILRPSTIKLIKEPLQDLSVGSHSESLQDLRTDDMISTASVLQFEMTTFQDDHAQRLFL